MAAFGGGGGFGGQSRFGQSTSAFGTNAFGNMGGSLGGNQSAFGAQSAFGSQPNSLFGSQGQSASAFGQSAPFGGSSFGAQPAPTFGSGFGGGQSSSAFGSGFGAQPNAAFGSGFGGQSSSAFGAASGGFGSGSSLFGANRPPTGGFGSSNPFGQSQPAWGQSSSAFGGSSTFGGQSGGGLFGSSAPANAVFGQGAGTSAFGSSSQKGSAGATWQVTTEYDGGSGQSFKYQSITMMNQFRDKSLEELRVEDYTAGNKGGPHGGGTGAFGNPQTGGLFGGSGSAFGSSTGGFGGGNLFDNTGGFGQSSSAGIFGGGGGVGSSSGFGQSSSSGFGSGGTLGAQSGSGAFGQQGAFGGQPSGGFAGSRGNLFGASSGIANTTSGGAFGSTSSGFGGGFSGGFGGGFGGAQQHQPSFGGGKSQPSLFGTSSQPPGSSIFGSGGNQSTPGMFGGNTGQQNAFGGGASGFGSTGTQGSLFGSGGSGAFGNTALGSTGFGNSGGSSFGGLNSGQNAANTGFGQAGSTFGSRPGQQQTALPNNFGASMLQPAQAPVIAPGAGINPTLQGTFAAVTQQHGATVAPQGANYGTVLHNLQKIQSEMGEQKKLMENQAKAQAASASKPNASVSVVVLPPPSLGKLSSYGGRSLAGGYGRSRSVSERTKTRGTAGRIGGGAARISGTPVRSPTEEATDKIPATPALSNTGVVRRMSFFSPQIFSAALKPRAVRASELSTPIPATPKMLPLPGRPDKRISSDSEGREVKPSASLDVLAERSEQASGYPESRPERETQSVALDEGTGTHAPVEKQKGIMENHKGTGSHHQRESLVSDESGIASEARRESRDNGDDAPHDADFVWARERPSTWSLNRPADSDDQYNPHKYLPSQTNPGYYTVPDMADLACRTMTELQHIENFTVGREGYGEITWVDPVDVRGLNLDEVVDIQRGEVAVFPEKEALQLDAPARVKLKGMFSKRKDAGDVSSDEERNERYKQKLEKYCSRNHLRFVQYDADKGEWVFEVQTFAD